MLPVVGWKIYTSDGVVSSRNTTLRRAPTTDIQCIVLYHEQPYRTLMDGRDSYVIPGDTTVRLGKGLSDAQFEVIKQAALNDRAWP